jgi:hypothetical protein
MTTVQEILKKQFDENCNQIHKFENEHQETLKTMVRNIIEPLHNYFKEVKIEVNLERINLKFPTDNWNGVELSRTRNFVNNSFNNVLLSINSISNANENELKKIICTAIIAEFCLNKTEEWDKLVSILDYNVELYNKDIKSLRDNNYEISNELDKIKRDESNNNFINIFNKGTMKLTRDIKFHWGNGRYDTILSCEFFWEENKGGKTYNLSYLDSVRTNPHYNEQGERLDGIYAFVKKNHYKRVKKHDIETLVRQNIHLI